jgi:hypothetical protein
MNKVFLRRCRKIFQGIPHLLWNPKLHYHTQNFPPLDCTLSKFILVHTRTTFFSSILMTSCLLLALLKYPLTFWFPDYNFILKYYSSPPFVLHAHPINIILLDLITIIKPLKAFFSVSHTYSTI